ncbi:MAG: hypothetical protein WCT85_00765 [Parachlamydiales bacterium]|jgi:hypothetical protein
MPRNKIEYLPEELNRDTHFSIVISNRNEIEYPLIDINEAKIYRYSTNRKVLIVTDNIDKYKNHSNLPTIKYFIVMNYSNPDVKICDLENKLAIETDIIELILSRYKNGLVIFDVDPKKYMNEYLPNFYKKLALYNDKTGIDFMIHRESLLDISIEEAKRSTLLRLHEDKNFSLSKQSLIDIREKFGDTGLGIAIAQFMVNQETFKTNKYIEELQEEKGDRFQSLCDKDELNRAKAYYIYYDVYSHKIINVKPEKFEQHCELFMKSVGAINYNMSELKQTYL